MNNLVKYYNLVPIRFKRASNILNLVKESYCLKMGIGLLKQKFPRKIYHIRCAKKQFGGEKSVFKTRKSRTPYSRAGIGPRHGVLSMNRIPIVVTAITPTGLVPNDFSHSLSLLSRSLSSPQSCGCGAGSDAGSFCWTPITDTMVFLKWLVGYRSLCAMTESSFGKIVSITNAGGMDISASPVLRTSFTYTGREWEEDVGLFYYRARWYDPGVGRFLQEDPEPGTILDSMTLINKYIYSRNNPLVFIDPTGKDNFLAFLAVSILSFGVGALAAGLVNGALGFAAGGWAAITVGTIVGVGAGGIVGALLFPALGLGTSQQGFLFGAISGGLGGFARGMGWLGDYNVKAWKGDGSTLKKGIEDGVNNQIKGMAAPGSASATFSLPSGSGFINVLKIIEPYVLGIAGGLVVDGIAYECSAGNCNIPTQSKSWEL